MSEPRELPLVLESRAAEIAEWLGNDAPYGIIEILHDDWHHPPEIAHDLMREAATELRTLRTALATAEREREEARKELAVIRAAAPSDGWRFPVWQCRACGCLWLDTLNGLVSLLDVEQKSCETCEQSPTDAVCDVTWFQVVPAERANKAEADVARLTAERDAALGNAADAAGRHYAAVHAEILARAEQAEAARATAREALRVILKAARGDEHSECITIRKWLDKRGVFNDDISGAERLIAEAARHALLVHADAPAARGEGVK